MAEFGTLSIVALGSFFYLLYWLFPKRLQWIPMALGYFALFALVSEGFSLVLFASTTLWIGLVRLAYAEREKQVANYLTYAGIGIWAIGVYASKINLGTDVKIPPIVGVSFVSFMGLSLIIDIRRKVVSKAPRLRDVIRYFTFFPYLLTGPIERFSTMEAQFGGRRNFELLPQTSGLFLIALGVFKKFVIADALDPMAGDSDHQLVQLLGAEVPLFLLLSFIQIYCNFSGIIDLVRGYSRLLGFEVSENFRQPYLAENVPDIWRRWNITLVSWLRDYVYTPLALKTKNLYLAAFAVMLLIGFWHKISLNYFYWAIYWTFLYGIAIALRSRALKWRIPLWLMRVMTLTLMCWSGIFFQTASLKDYVTILGNVFRSTGVSFGTSLDRLWHIGLPAGSKPYYSVTTGLLIVVVSTFLVVLLETLEAHSAHAKVSEQRKIILYVAGILGLFFLTAALSSGTGTSIPFIYLSY